MHSSGLGIVCRKDSEVAHGQLLDLKRCRHRDRAAGTCGDSCRWNFSPRYITTLYIDICTWRQLTWEPIFVEVRSFPGGCSIDFKLSITLLSSAGVACNATR